MARKKEPTKPLFGMKQDFYDSLDNVAQQGIMLIQAVDHAIQLNAVSSTVAPILRERVDAFRKSLMSDE